MVLQHLDLFIPSVVALVAVLYVVPWHLRIRNVATLSMSFWMISLNIVHVVNSLVWNDNIENRAPIWGDIGCTIIVGYNFGLPLSHLLLARQLEALTSLRSRSVIHDVALKRRNRLVDLGISLMGPIVGILVHLTQMDRRYYIVEGYGPMQSTYWNAWGTFWMAFMPIIIAIGALIFTVMALVNIYLRRAKMLTMISSDSRTSKDQFVRLYVLSVAELATCLMRAYFNLISYANGPQPFAKGPSVGGPINLATVGVVTESMVTPDMRRSMLLQWYTVVACSIVFFFCFATGFETTRFYKRLLSRCLPFVVDPDEADMVLLSHGSRPSVKRSQSSSEDTYSSTNAILHDKLNFYPLDPMSPGPTPMTARSAEVGDPLVGVQGAVQKRTDSESMHSGLATVDGAQPGMYRPHDVASAEHDRTRDVFSTGNAR